MEPSFEFLRFFEYLKLDTWDINRNTHDVSTVGMIQLSKILHVYKKKISKKEAIENKLQIVSKISFKGELFLNDLNKIYDVKGDLFEIPDNSITYSKINVRHGCCLWNNTGNNILASSEYPVLMYDKRIISPEYLILCIRSPIVLKQFNAKLRGFTKARVSLDEFLSVYIPLPSLEKQNQLVAKYNSRLKQAEESLAKANGLEASIDEYLIKELGIENTSTIQKTNKIFQTVEYKKLDIWDVNYRKQSLFSNVYDNIEFTKTLLTIKSKINKLNKGSFKKTGKIPIISQEKEFISGYTDLNIEPIKEIDLPLIVYGDHSQTKKLIDFSFVIGADGVRLIKPDNRFNIKYYLYFLELIDFNPEQKYTRHYKYLNKTSIPLPPLDVQNKIVEHIANIKKEIEFLRADAKALKEIATLDFEQEVFNPCN